MNIPTPVKLADLKEGKLYFKEVTKKMTSKYYYIIIVKIEKIQLERKPNLIAYSYSTLENYSLFGEITDFNNSQTYNVCCHESEFNFYKTCIQRRDKAIKHSFYKFEEEWFLRNKKKILSNVTSCSQTKKPFSKLFQTIKKEKK
ncbi:MAG: hypothetical protein BWY04_01470 [candidate division CPR1 bacterium ADurb.Bin160]|uniref:Uncharacterized protein n=1 Tax=candidate division CPR1 bacterium ADurb.Bin160 TaxID=1852826 RepID=A0A1V5ZIK6_9BACT|nr:MAG: hypothetical protein BWY04_01470 [candidate division CPR1 bacterium ADurb.Bin160]